MKIWTRLCCALLIGGMLLSCSHAPQRDPNDNSARDAFFAQPREKTPWTATGTVDGVAYEVTFDRKEYILGEDITFSVKATNVSGEVIPVGRAWNLDECDTMSASFFQNDVKQGGGFSIPYELLTMYLETEWQLGEMWEKEGYFCTSVLDATVENAGVLEFRIQANEREPFCVEIPVRVDIPEDALLLPYLESGRIDDKLYRRARTLNREDSLVVLCKKSVPLAPYLPGVPEEEIPEWNQNQSVLFPYRYIRLTREQLLMILEHGFPEMLLYDGWGIYNWFDNYSYCAI